LQDGTSHYMKGVILCLAYCAIGACFFFHKIPISKSFLIIIFLYTNPINYIKWYLCIPLRKHFTYIHKKCDYKILYYHCNVTFFRRLLILSFILLIPLIMDNNKKLFLYDLHYQYIEVKSSDELLTIFLFGCVGCC